MRDFPPPLASQPDDAMQAAIDLAAADIADVYGTSPDEAAATMRRALSGMAVQSPGCIGADPYCPCQDGDPCHYLPLPGTLAAEIAKVRATLDDLAAERHPLVRLYVWRLRRRLAQTERTIEDARDRALARYFQS